MLNKITTALVSALELQLATRRPFADKPEGLGLQYVRENLLATAWAARQEHADEVARSAIKLAKEAA